MKNFNVLYIVVSFMIIMELVLGIMVIASNSSLKYSIEHKGKENVKNYKDTVTIEYENTDWAEIPVSYKIDVKEVRYKDGYVVTYMTAKRLSGTMDEIIHGDFQITFEGWTSIDESAIVEVLTNKHTG